MRSRYRDLFEVELDTHHVVWCRGDRWREPAVADDIFGRSEPEWIEAPCPSRRSRGGKHSASGGAWATEWPSGGASIHLGREVATRYGLQIALHEVAHVVLGHTDRRRRRQRVFEREAAAEAWSFQRMDELAVPVPEASRRRAADYVAYRKRRGDRVIARQVAKKKRGAND